MIESTNTKPLRRHQKIRAVLAANGFIEAGFSQQQLRWLREQGIMPPIAGGAPDEDEDEDEDDDDAKKKGDADDEEDEKPKKGGKDDKDDDEDEDEVKLSRAEHQRLKRKAKEADEAKKAADEEKAKAERKKKQEEGRWQELIDEEKLQTKTEKERADKAEAELIDYKFEVAVGRVANRLNFKDPTDAYLYLGREFDKESDETQIERALKKVLDGKPYLKGDRKGTGGNGNGTGSGSGGFSMDQIKSMTPDQINENWSKPGFQDALKQAGR